MGLLDAGAGLLSGLISKIPDRDPWRELGRLRGRLALARQAVEDADAALHDAEERPRKVRLQLSKARKDANDDVLRLHERVRTLEQQLGPGPAPDGGA